MNKSVIGVSVVLAGCITPPGYVKFEQNAPSAMYAPPAYAQPQPQAATGAIFQAATYKPLFEDNRARRIGDTLTINLVEKTSASRKASSTTNRDSDASASIGNIAKLPLKGLTGLAFNGESASKFNGKGETASDALLTGVLTVTVQQVLPNGNLFVAGEKQVGVNSNMERLRFAGVVNPTTILSGNTVNSTAVADARIELSGSGTLDETQTMGWLQRFFLSVWPI